MRLFPLKCSKPALPSKQTLQAAVARRAARAPSLEEEEEPTTSFKTALVVVLLLHVVAGGGILMFDRIKTRRPNAVEPSVSAQANQKSATATAAVTPAARPKAVAAVASVETTKKTTSASTGIPAAAELKDSGTFYTVSKGDNPVAIAKKLRVGYDDLLKLNRIEDPKKLRIGQKLHVPMKARSSAN